MVNLPCYCIKAGNSGRMSTNCHWPERIGCRYSQQWCELINNNKPVPENKRFSPAEAVSRWAAAWKSKIAATVMKGNG